MSTAIATREPDIALPAAVEQALLHGDLGQLSTEHRLNFYHARCRAAGLNPMSKPFAYVKMTGGKTVLYALKECAEQLNQIHKISHSVTSINCDDKKGVIEVMCQALMGNGRSTFELGAVSIDGLRGEALCNAKMKAITKAKRRATLSLCGLGDMMDESELDTIQTFPCNEKGNPVPVDNGTGIGSGKYSSEENAKRYLEEISGYLQSRCSAWLDRWTDQDGAIRDGVKDLCHLNRLDSHLAKWCEQQELLKPGTVPEGGPKARQHGFLVSIPWFRSDKEKNRIKRECKGYLDKIEEDETQRVLAKEAAQAEPTEADESLADDEWEDGRE